MANEATAVIKPLLPDAKSTVGLYQAVIQLTPKSYEAWVGTCLTQEDRMVSESPLVENKPTSIHTDKSTRLHVPVVSGRISVISQGYVNGKVQAKYLGLDCFDRETETPGRLIRPDHYTCRPSYLTLIHQLDSAEAVYYDSDLDDTSRIFQYDSDFDEEDCGHDNPATCRGISFGSGEDHLHDFELVVDFLGAKAVESAITEALKPSEGDRQKVPSMTSSSKTNYSSSGKGVNLKAPTVSKGVSPTKQGILKATKAGGSREANVSTYLNDNGLRIMEGLSEIQLTIFRDVQDVLLVPRSQDIGQPSGHRSFNSEHTHKNMVHFASPLATPSIRTNTGPPSTPIEPVYHVFGPEILLPDGFYEHFCKITGLPLSLRVQDSTMWRRIVHVFLLRFAEEVCDEYGRIGWLERQQAIPFAADDPELLSRHIRIFHAESTTEVKGNIFLHPLERLSARQCLEFIIYAGSPSNPELSHVLTIVCELLNFRMRDTIKATEINTRRAKGELGRPGNYPPIFEDRYGVIASSMEAEFKRFFEDFDDEMGSPDSY